jgi:hypothetical protein
LSLDPGVDRESSERVKAALWLGAGGAIFLAGGGILYAVGQSILLDLGTPAPPYEPVSHGLSVQRRGRLWTGVGIGIAGAGLASATAALVLYLTREPPQSRPLAWRYGIGAGQITLGRDF